MDFTEYPISQSLIRRLFFKQEEKDVCPRQIYEVMILKIVDQEPTPPMLKGKFFETLCLGSGRGGEKIEDLPRKKLTTVQERDNRILISEGKSPMIGEKTIDQIRIEDQAERFKILSQNRQMFVDKDHGTNTQIPLMLRWEKDQSVLITMELDIFPTPIILKEELELAIVDLKLTGDINSTFGEYCYGIPDELDPIQSQMYHYGVRNIDPELNPHTEELLSESLRIMINGNKIKFVLWVFNYKKTQLEDKLIEFRWDKSKEAELHETIRKTKALLEMHDEMGWPTDPSYKKCKHCPLLQCDDRIEYETI
jgi:hypothetical protein